MCYKIFEIEITNFLFILVFKSPTKVGGKGSLTMKEMRLRLSPMKPYTSSHSGGGGTQRPFGGDLDDSSDTEEASLYQEPLRLLDNSGGGGGQEYR